jgi:hypothetical protein
MWKSRFLSFGGRLILLKSVATSVAIYTLSFFKASSGIISFIESLLYNFFWVGVRILEKSIGLIGKLFVSVKEYGGLGVR